MKVILSSNAISKKFHQSIVTYYIILSKLLTYYIDSIQRMREAGLMNKLIKVWLSADRTCTMATEISASITDVAIIFILLMGGATVSCFLVAAEIMVQYVLIPTSYSISNYEFFHFTLKTVHFFIKNKMPQI